MVSATPNNKAAAADQTVGEIAIAIRAGEYERAALLANSVIALGMHHPLVYNARALALQQKGQYREALTEFSRARGLAPNDPNLLVAIGVCFINLGTPAEALQALDGAIALDPKNAQAHYRKGWTLEMLGEHEKARAEYEHAISADPKHPEALGSLAALLALRGNVEEAKALAERALAVSPDQTTAINALGVVDLAQRNFASAEDRFRRAGDDPQLTLRARAVVRGLLGDALDGQGRSAEAFECYRFEKNELRKLYAHNYTNRPRPREFADRISGYLNASSPDVWRPDAAEGSGQPLVLSHVFVVGFPQSADARIESALASHPQIALTTRDLLADISEMFLTTEAGLQHLGSFSPQELETHRKTYWDRVRESGLNIDNKVLVDVQASNTIKLPLLAKLFPNAKIVFQLRDPRDVVLSCYRRHFEINPINFEFLTPESAVELYEAMMRIATAAREKLALKEHICRFEDFAADFDKSFAGLCDFIGADAAKSVAPAPVRPLQSESAVGWRLYRDELRYVLPQLRPWAEKFGYTSD